MVITVEEKKDNEQREEAGLSYLVEWLEQQVKDDEEEENGGGKGRN